MNEARDPDLFMLNGKFERKALPQFHTKFEDLFIGSLFTFNDVKTVGNQEVSTKTDLMLFRVWDKKDTTEWVRECRIVDANLPVIPLVKVSNLPFGAKVILLKDLNQKWVITGKCSRVDSSFKLRNSNRFVSLSVRPDELCIVTN